MANRKKKLLNSEVDKYMPERQAIMKAWSNSHASELAEQFLNGEVPKQFIPKLKFRKKLESESEEEYEDSKIDYYNELEVYRVKTALGGWKFMVDKVIQLMPKQHSVGGKIDHEFSLAQKLAEANEAYVPEGASVEAIQKVEAMALGDVIDVEARVEEGDREIREGKTLSEEQLLIEYGPDALKE